MKSSVHERINEGDAHLRQHIDQQVVQIQQALDAARRETNIIHDSSEKAIQKAEGSSEKRFAAVNAFREQLNDQAKDFMPREVADAQIKELDKRISAIQQSQDTNAGKDQGSDKTTAFLIATSTLALGVVVVIVNILV